MIRLLKPIPISSVGVFCYPPHATNYGEISREKKTWITYIHELGA